MMFKSHLIALLGSRYSVLLKWNFNTIPDSILFASVNREMSLFKQFKLITHVHDGKSDSCSLRNALH